MFLVDYLITEAGFGDYGQPDTGGEDEGEQGLTKIEHEDIKKFMLYEQVKQIYQKLNQMQFDQVDDEFYALLNFCQNIIEFFNNFEYPEAVHLVDNLVDGIEEKLGLKLPPRIPHEQPEDEFPEEDQIVDPNQPPQPGQPPAQPAQPASPNAAGPRPNVPPQ